MRWLVRQGNILDHPADVLICPAGPFLTLFGGVGGALLLRYGPALQTELNDHLTRTGRRHLPPGEVVVTDAPATPYKAVIHAVAVDGFYDSSPAIGTAAMRAARLAAAGRGARTVALTAMVTGYGRLTIAKFFVEGLLPFLSETFGAIQTVTAVVRGSADPGEIRRVAPAIDLI